jgi:uncharacterized membrane protein YbhN (UPF0104 family)
MTSVAQDAAPARARSKHLVLWIRVLVSVGMLVFLFVRMPREELSDLFSEWTARDIEWLLAALGVTAGAVVLGAMRWRQVLRTLGVKVNLYRLTMLHLSGQFVGNFLPTTVGGDVLRIRRLSRITQDAPRTFASVVIERLTGWVVLPLMTFAAFAINPGLAKLGAASSSAMGLAIATLVVLLVLVWVAEHPLVGRRLNGGGQAKQMLSGLHLGLGEFRKRPREVVRLLGVGVLYQGALIVATALAAEALKIDVSPTAWLAFAPVVLIAQVLPLSIGGLGVREGALVLFLGPLGVTDAEAILLGLLLYAITLIVSLLGAPSFAIGWGRGLDKEITQKIPVVKDVGR